MSGGIIFGNKIIDMVFLSTMSAQIIKIFLPLLKGEGINIGRIFETGGMPSSHSSSVATLCTSIYFIYGSSNVAFAVALIFAIIVMYDATGIRREAGKHAKVLNEILFHSDIKLLDSKEFKEFKEFLGHTPLEVLCGCILGIIIPIIFRGYLL